jgi:hypothetical protein
MTFRKRRTTYSEGCDLHVSRDWQFVICQAALRMNESERGAFWKPCAPPPFEREKKTYKKRVKGGLDAMVRTSHAIVGKAQFKRQRRKARNNNETHFWIAIRVLWGKTEWA